MICFNGNKFKTLDDKLYFGSRKIKKVFYGNTLIYPEQISPTPTHINATLRNSQSFGYPILGSTETWSIAMIDIKESALTSIEVYFVVPTSQYTVNELYSVDLITSTKKKKSNGQWIELGSDTTEIALSKSLQNDIIYYQIVIPNAEYATRVVHIRHSFNPDNIDTYTLNIENFYQPS
jgi:hypothetical protein